MRPTIEAQLGRPPRGAARVAVRCPHGRPAVVEQDAYLAGRRAVPDDVLPDVPARRVADRPARGRAAAWTGTSGCFVGTQLCTPRTLAASDRQRALRRPAAEMADGGASLRLGIAGVTRDGAVKCLHAHAAFALAEPGYALGMRILAEAEPVFPEDRCCCG